MPLTAPKPVRTLVPEGTHLARVVELIHLGTRDDVYQGEPIVTNKIWLTFELQDGGDDSKPHLVSQEYSLSMGDKSNLRKLVEGIIGTRLHDGEADGFDVESLLNMSCLVVIKHKTSGKGVKRAEVSSASPLMKGQTCPPAKNPVRVLTYQKWNEEHFNSLPEFLKEKMSESKEFAIMRSGASAPEVKPNDVPFP